MNPSHSPTPTEHIPNSEGDEPCQDESKDAPAGPPLVAQDRELTPAELANCVVRVGEVFPWKGVHWKVRHITLRTVLLEPVGAIRKREKPKHRKR